MNGTAMMMVALLFISLPKAAWSCKQTKGFPGNGSEISAPEGVTVSNLVFVKGRGKFQQELYFGYFAFTFYPSQQGSPLS